LSRQLCSQVLYLGMLTMSPLAADSNLEPKKEVSRGHQYDRENNHYQQ
jgi:hypothetical protein